MPTMTAGLQKVANFISGFDNIKGVLEVLIPVLAGAAAGLAAFLLVSNAGAIIGALVKAFQALNAVVMANPLAAIAGIVVAVLIPAIMLLIKNWDMVVLVFQDTINALSTQFQIFGSKIAEALTVGFNTAKIAVLSLAQAIYVNVLNGIAKLLEVMGKLPLVGEMFDNASAAVKGMANSLDGAIVAAKNESAAAIKASKDKQDALELELTKKARGVQTRIRSAERIAPTATGIEHRRNSANASERSRDNRSHGTRLPNGLTLWHKPKQ